MNILTQEIAIWQPWLSPRMQKRGKNRLHFAFLAWKRLRNRCHHQWSTRRDPQSRQLWTLFSLFCDMKSGDERTDTCTDWRHVRKQWFLPAVLCFGRVDQNSQSFLCVFLAKAKRWIKDLIQFCLNSCDENFRRKRSNVIEDRTFISDKCLIF